MVVPKQPVLGFIGCLGIDVLFNGRFVFGSMLLLFKNYLYKYKKKELFNNVIPIAIFSLIRNKNLT